MGKVVFIDFVYDLTINALSHSKETECNQNMDSLFDDTLYERINEQLEKEFNCTVPFLPQIKSKITGDYVEICRNPNKSVNAYRQYDYLRASGQSTLCQSPCGGMDIYLGLPFISTNDWPQSQTWAFIKIYLKSTVKIKSEVLDYSPLQLLAEVGGYVGLLLGISAVNVVIIINSVLTKYVKKKLMESGM